MHASSWRSVAPVSVLICMSWKATTACSRLTQILTKASPNTALKFSKENMDVLAASTASGNILHVHISRQAYTQGDRSEQDIPNVLDHGNKCCLIAHDYSLNTVRRPCQRLRQHTVYCAFGGWRARSLDSMNPSSINTSGFEIIVND